MYAWYLESRRGGSDCLGTSNNFKTIPGIELASTYRRVASTINSQASSVALGLASKANFIQLVENLLSQNKRALTVLKRKNSFWLLSSIKCLLNAKC